MYATPNRSQIMLDLHHLLCQAQRQNRFVGTTANTDLSLIESHILLELDAQSNLTLSELSALLGCDQRIVSRVVGELEHKQLLSRKKHASDNRKRLLHITGQAKRVLKDVDQIADRQITKSLSGLSVKDREAIERFYSSLAEGAGFLSTKRRQVEHSLRPLQRQAARALGFLSNNAFSSGLSSLAFHVLAVLGSVTNPISLKTLGAALAMKPSNLSQIISKFEQDSFIERQAALDDRRVCWLFATQKGRSKITELHRRSARRIEALLHAVSTDDLRRFAKAYSRYVECGASGNEFELNTLIHCKGEDSNLRGFFARELVRLNRSTLLPAVLCGPTSVTYTTLMHSEVVIAVHFLVEKDISKLTCIAWSKELDLSPNLEAIIEKCCRLEFEKGRSIVLEVKPSAFNFKDFSRLAIYREARRRQRSISGRAEI